MATPEKAFGCHKFGLPNYGASSDDVVKNYTNPFPDIKGIGYSGCPCPLLFVINAVLQLARGSLTCLLSNRTNGKNCQHSFLDQSLIEFQAGWDA